MSEDLLLLITNTFRLVIIFAIAVITSGCTYLYEQLQEQAKETAYTKNELNELLNRFERALENADADALQSLLADNVFVSVPYLGFPELAPGEFSREDVVELYSMRWAERGAPSVEFSGRNIYFPPSEKYEVWLFGPYFEWVLKARDVRQFDKLTGEYIIYAEEMDDVWYITGITINLDLESHIDRTIDNFLFGHLTLDPELLVQSLAPIVTSFNTVEDPTPKKNLTNLQVEQLILNRLGGKDPVDFFVDERAYTVDGDEAIVTGLYLEQLTFEEDKQLHMQCAWADVTIGLEMSDRGWLINKVHLENVKPTGPHPVFGVGSCPR